MPSDRKFTASIISLIGSWSVARERLKRHFLARRDFDLPENLRKSFNQFLEVVNVLTSRKLDGEDTFGWGNVALNQAAKSHVDSVNRWQNERNSGNTQG